MALFNRGKEKKAMEEAQKAAEEAKVRAQKAEKELKAMKDEKAKKDFFAKQKAKAAAKPVPKTIPGPGKVGLSNVAAQAKPKPMPSTMSGLRIPSAGAAMKPATGPAIIAEYTVKKGDTLGAIAKQFYGVTGPEYWNLIQEANKDLIKNVNLIYPGQVFKIPVLPDSLKSK